MPATVNHTFLRRLRTLGTVEGISTLILFGIAMPLKYLADMPMAVRIAWSIHGGLFVALVVMFLLGIRRIPLPPRLAGVGIVAAVFPFGPFIMDRRLDRIGRRSDSIAE
jgi:integral membrane protein